MCVGDRLPSRIVQASARSGCSLIVHMCASISRTDGWPVCSCISPSINLYSVFEYFINDSNYNKQMNIIIYLAVNTWY